MTEQARDEDENKKDIEEVRHAVKGFNPLIRHVGKDNIPVSGVRGEIFDHRQWNDKTDEYEVPDYLSYTPMFDCSTTANTKVKDTFQSFFSDSSGSYDFNEHSKNDTEIKILWYQRSYGSQIQTNLHEEWQDIKSFYGRNHSEVYSTTAQCLLDQYEVKELATKVFAKEFRQSLELLSNTFLDNAIQTEQKYVVFKKFITDYGFFYINKVVLGAQLKYESIYSNKASSEHSATKRGRCESQATFTYDGAGFDTGDFEFSAGVETKGGLSATVSGKLPGVGYSDGTQHSDASKQCGKNDNNRRGMERSGLTVNKVISIGSKPTTLDKWLNQKWKPQPVHFTLREMSSLFDPKDPTALKSIENVNQQIIKDGNRTQIDVHVLYDGYTKFLKEYCWREKLNCSQLHETGCGLSVKCPHNQRCENDPKAKNGYRCVKGIILYFHAHASIALAINDTSVPIFFVHLKV